MCQFLNPAQPKGIKNIEELDSPSFCRKIWQFTYLNGSWHQVICAWSGKYMNRDLAFDWSMSQMREYLMGRLIHQRRLTDTGNKTCVFCLLRFALYNSTPYCSLIYWSLAQNSLAFILYKDFIRIQDLSARTIIITHGLFSLRPRHEHIQAVHKDLVAKTFPTLM